MNSSSTDVVATNNTGTQATLDITTAKWMTWDPVTESWRLDEDAHSPTPEVQSLAKPALWLLLLNALPQAL